MQGSSLRGRIVRTVGAGALGQGMNMVSRIVLVPLFLACWGSDLYGEWLLLSSLAAWLSLGDLGGQLYFINRLTALWAASGATPDTASGAVEGEASFAALWATAWSLFLSVPVTLVGVFLVAIWGALALDLPLGPELGVHQTSAQTVTVVLSFLALQIGASLPMGLLLGLYRVIGAQATSAMFANLLLFLQVSLTALVLGIERAGGGGGLLPMAGVQALATLFVCAGALWDLPRRLRQAAERDEVPPSVFDPAQFCLWSVRGARRDVAWQAFSPSLHFFAIQMAQALTIQGSLMAVGRSLGAREVALFATLRTVINLVRQILGLLANSAWPEFTRLFAAGQSAALGSLFMNLLRMTFLCLAGVAFGLELVGQQAFDLWVHHSMTYDSQTMRALVVMTALGIGWTMPANVLMATNAHLALARVQMVMAAVGVGACFVGAQRGGLSGAVLGLALGEAMMACAVVRLVWHKPWRPRGRRLGGEVLAVALTLAAVMLGPWWVGGASCLALVWISGFPLLARRRG